MTPRARLLWWLGIPFIPTILFVGAFLLHAWHHGLRGLPPVLSVIIVLVGAVTTLIQIVRPAKQGLSRLANLPEGDYRRLLGLNAVASALAMAGLTAFICVFLLLPKLSGALISLLIIAGLGFLTVTVILMVRIKSKPRASSEER